MKKMNLLNLPVMLFFICLLPLSGRAQNCAPLDAPHLKEMLVQLGYTVKEIGTGVGKEKFEVPHKTTALNVPVAYEISPSTNFVWLTVFLGQPKDTAMMPLALLRQNGKIQPCQFYISEKGNLMMGLAVENRGLTNAIMRRHTDKIIADVDKTAYIWQK